MTDEPSKLVDAIEVAKATKQIVMQKIVIALGIKSVFLILGALGTAGMWEAVFGDEGVTILAVLNAMRILKESEMRWECETKTDSVSCYDCFSCRFWCHFTFTAFYD